MRQTTGDRNAALVLNPQNIGENLDRDELAADVRSAAGPLPVGAAFNR